MSTDPHDGEMTAFGLVMVICAILFLIFFCR
jgi:hypothetical protein